MSKSVLPKAWDGRNCCVAQLEKYGYRNELDETTDIEVFLGKGGPDNSFYHHFIIIDPTGLRRRKLLVFELIAAGGKKTKGHRVIANVRKLEEPISRMYHKCSATSTLRYLNHFTYVKYKVYS